MVNNNKMNTAKPHNPEQLTDDDHLDLIFKALADRTRRAQLKRLTQGLASVSELAEPFAMSLPAASKHLKVLERAKLVSTSKVGRVHYCQLQPGVLNNIDNWLNHYRQFWQNKLDRLAQMVETNEK
jgi:DNA-binding transcriptional ArsR family regulator